MIRSLFKTKKRALRSFDDKRLLLADGISSIAFGHRDINTNIRDVELVGDTAMLIGSEEAVNRLVRIGTARDPTNADPGDRNTTGAASSS